MPGLLDLVDDPNQLGLLSLGLRLMSTPGKFGAALGQAGMGALGDVQQARSALEARKLREQQMRFQQLQEERASAAEQRLAALAPIQQEAAVLQLRQAQEAERVAQEQRARDDAFIKAIPSPQGQALQALGANASPTMANAARMPQVDPRNQFLYEALQARQLKPMEYLTATAKDDAPIKLGPDEVLLSGRSSGYKTLAQGLPKASDTPAAIREYQFAVNQGYTDTFQQFQLEQKRAGATNIGLPKIDIKVGEGVAGQVGPLLKETREQALSGLKLVDSANRILEAAEKGNLYAGPTANLRLKGAQVADVLGLGGKDTKEKITNTRTVVRAMAEQGVAARSQLGGQAQISNSEQDLLNRATSGDINDLTAGEIVQIATLNDRLGRQLYERHTQSLAGLKNTPNTQNLAPFFRVPELPPAFVPKRPAAPQFLGFEPQVP